MKKNIIISTQLIDIGGVEKSLLGLLDTIDYEQYNVDVFIYNHEGSLLPYLNDKVHLIPESKQYAGLFKPFSVLLKNRQFDALLVKGLATLKAKWRKRFIKQDPDKQDSIYHTYLIYFASKIFKPVATKSYDACLAFLHPNFVETKKIKARKYVAWIHTDYSRLNIDKKLEEKMWSAFDTIVGVSEECSNTFEDTFPVFKGKTGVIENIISYHFIQNELHDLRDADFEKYKKNPAFKLLTIGRYSYSKNFEIIPEVVASLIAKGITDIKWYIIGFGGDEAKIKEKVEVYNLNDFVIFLGKKQNPYIYTNACDLYVQPSRFEGKAVTVREAQILKKPVLITDYPTAASQVKDGTDGVIVPIDKEALANAIIQLKNDPDYRKKLSDNCNPMDYTNHLEVEKIYKLIDEA